MGLPPGISSCPQDQDDTGVAAEARSGIYQRRGLALGGPDLKPLDYELGLFGRTWLPKSSQPRQSEEIPRESSGRHPHGDGACRDRMAGASQGLLRGGGDRFE